jgi:hypothetical protein
MSEVSAEQQQPGADDEARLIQYLQENPEVLMKYPGSSSTCRKIPKS